MCGMGGPDGPDAVEPFLRNLFSDPLIIGAPGFVRLPLARLIAWRRAPKVRRRYASIDPAGGSPQLGWTVQQAERLTRRLIGRGRDVVPLAAMRYWHPFPEEAVTSALAAGAEQFLLVPAYPHYAEPTTGSILDAVLSAISKLAPGASVHAREDWHAIDGYLAALASRVADIMREWNDLGADIGDCVLLPVAHSLPVSRIRRDDRYTRQIASTLRGVEERLAAMFGTAAWTALTGDGVLRPTYQSRVGPVEWLKPDIVDEVKRLGATGRRLMVLPISITCEHIETLHELDIELRETALDAGFTDYRRAPALNLDGTWLGSLADHLDAVAYGEDADDDR